MKIRAVSLLAVLTLISGISGILTSAEEIGGRGKAAEVLAGKLVVTDGKGGAVDFAFEKEPEFYLVFHSASW